MLEKFNRVDEQYLQIKTNDLNLMPKRMYPTDAGLDLKAKQDYLLTAYERVLVGTGIQVKIPESYVGLLFPRSSLSKQGIIMTNSVGVIDSDYRGEVLASLCYINNVTSIEMPNHVHISKYDRIVQLVLVPISLLNPIIFDGTEEEWNDTTRGHGSFGSTGK